MSLYLGTTEITKLRDLAPQTGLDITDLWFGETNVYTVWQTYEGTLPATINANGDNLRQYQVWGNVGGVGDVTENLFDVSNITHEVIDSAGAKRIESGMDLSGFIEVDGNYTVSWKAVRVGAYMRVSTFDENKNFIERVTALNTYTNTHYSNSHTGYIRINYENEYGLSDVMLTEGTTPPASFVPFGYDVDMAIRDTTTINIGNEPLCGIGTYTDSLDLSTGILTRRIAKRVLTGQENWKGSDNTASKYFSGISNYKQESGVTCMSTHYSGVDNVVGGDPIPNNSACFFIEGNLRNFYLKGSEPITLADFKSYLAAQYAAGTPVTVWYVLTESKISTITVPSGLTGTIEGYLIQDGTPTPETPIYPTANGVKQADGTYSIKYSTSSTTTPIYIGDDPLDKDEYVDYQAGKIYRMINGALTPTDPPVALPALPTCEGETVIDYAGSGTAPEKVLLKYRKEEF